MRRRKAAGGALQLLKGIGLSAAAEGAAGRVAERGRRVEERTHPLPVEVALLDLLLWPKRVAPDEADVERRAGVVEPPGERGELPLVRKQLCRRRVRRRVAQCLDGGQPLPHLVERAGRCGRSFRRPRFRDIRVVGEERI